MNEFRNMLLAGNLPTEDVDKLLLKIVDKVNIKEVRIMKSSFKQNGGIYRQVGDFKISNLTLAPEEANITLGKRGERVPVALK